MDDAIIKISGLLKNDLSAAVEKEKDHIIQSLIEMAKGMWVLHTIKDKNGKFKNIKLYQEKPDPEVAQYLLNQFIGKPRQNVELSSDPDKPLIIQVAPQIASKYHLSDRADLIEQ